MHNLRQKQINTGNWVALIQICNIFEICISFITHTHLIACYGAIILCNTVNK